MAETTAATRCRECEDPYPLDAEGRIPAHPTPFGWVNAPHPPCSGGGRLPLTRKDYVVRGVLRVTIRVPGAKDADDAAWMVDNDEGELKVEYDGLSIEEVVSADKADDFNAPDERTRCARRGCGHLIAEHTGLWSDKDGKAKTHPTRCDRLGCECLSPVEPLDDDPAEKEGQK